ncbi:MAG: hypothetical protein R2774_04285 [Saprospiraceae bacterium]
MLDRFKKYFILLIYITISACNTAESELVIPSTYRSQSWQLASQESFSTQNGIWTQIPNNSGSLSLMDKVVNDSLETIRQLYKEFSIERYSFTTQDNCEIKFDSVDDVFSVNFTLEDHYLIIEDSLIGKFSDDYNNLVECLAISSKIFHDSSNIYSVVDFLPCNIKDPKSIYEVLKKPISNYTLDTISVAFINVIYEKQ